MCSDLIQGWMGRVPRKVLATCRPDESINNRLRERALGLRNECLARPDRNVDELEFGYSIIGDGNCLFRAISLYLYGTQENHMLLRYKAVAYLREHWKDVKNHLVIDRERMRDEERYCREMEAYGTYGTSVECFALSEVLQKNVVIFLQERSLSRIMKPKSKPIIISKRRYSQTIYLQLLGNPENGHFELLKPLIPQ